MQISLVQIEQIYAHARRELPNECCGLLGGRDDFVCSVYELENAAENPLIEYEAVAKDLFAAQKNMRERGETLVGIYHSHPRQTEPIPSETDVERAFYEEAVYFIVGFDGEKPILRAFKISEKHRTWEQTDFSVID